MKIKTKTKLIKSIISLLVSSDISKECIKFTLNNNLYTLTYTKNGMSLNKYTKDNTHITEIKFRNPCSNLSFIYMNKEEKEYFNSLNELIKLYQELVQQVNDPFADILKDFGV